MLVPFRFEVVISDRWIAAVYWRIDLPLWYKRSFRPPGRARWTVIIPLCSWRCP